MLPFLADDAVRPGLQPDGRVAVRRSPAMPQPDGLQVERCSAAMIEEHAQAWAALVDRALEPNVFMEPGFALPAIRHVVPAQRPTLLLCWDVRDPGERHLIGILAVQSRRWPGFVPAAMAWHHPLWVTSAPLLDRDRAAEALDAMLAALATERWMGGGLMLRGVPTDGPLMRLVEAGGGRTATILAHRNRAVLRRTGKGDAGVAPGPSAKHAKELRRQRRRLAEAGPCVLRSACSVDEVRVATERFLDLEARGWKGARGTAMLRTPRLATFTRTMTRLMARQGRCRIDTLEVGGEAVAIGIVLRSGTHGYFWKTAYDESRARHSPGKQLAEALGDLQAADTTLALTDSCAVPDHPMIDRLWKDRIVVADLLVAGPASGRAWTVCAAGALRFGQAARARAKQAFHAVRACLKGR